MNRRGFLKGLGGVVLGLSAISILPQATTYKRTWKWKKAADSGIIVPNPEWETAPYEFRYIVAQRAFQTFNLGPGPALILVDRNKPLVFNRSNPNQPLKDVAMISDAMPVRMKFNEVT